MEQPTYEEACKAANVLRTYLVHSVVDEYVDFDYMQRNNGLYLLYLSLTNDEVLNMLPNKDSPS
jgi:hypothetical protein